MGIQRCEYCDLYIDTDVDAEHFYTEMDIARCINEEQYLITEEENENL